MKTVWRLIHARMYSVACQMARRGPPVGVVERVLADTGRMVDPTEVLNSVSYALERVTRGTARFLRHGTLPAGDFPEAPAALAKVASCDCRAFLARPQVGELAPHFSEAFESLSADLLIPVRRGATLYGFFAVRCDEVSRDTAQVCATLADHVAIKLENFVLYTEASARSRELDETRLFLENLVESLPVGVAVLDRENRVKAWNPALAASSGVSPECAMGKHYFRDLFPGLLSAGAQSIVDSLRKDPWKIVHRAGMAGHIAGGPEHVDLTVAAFRSRTGLPDGVVVITQDATERVLLGRELEESRRLASLGAFAAAIAHDIRTPLTSIQMNVQILRSRGVLSEGDNEYLDIASEEIERLNRSVGEILDYAKPLALSVEATDVDDLLDDVVRTVQPVFGERRVALVRGPRRPELRVGVDARRMRTALVNLLDNAADASPSGTCVELSAALGEDGRVCIRVEDHGRGIDEANLEKVFEPFFTTRPDGTGLGLAIARKVVRAHGGELDVRSTVGEGTTFTIALAAGSRGSLEPGVAVSSARRFASTASS
jgi:PAS domain S-box-containing protein